MSLVYWSLFFFIIKGFPKDSFHVACGSHIARIKNILNPRARPHRESSVKTAFRQSVYGADRVCGEAEEGFNK
jgi:hypothetical protein